MKEWKVDRICVPTIEDFEIVLNEHEKAGHTIKEIIPLRYDYTQICDSNKPFIKKSAEMNMGNYQIIYTKEN